MSDKPTTQPTTQGRKYQGYPYVNPQAFGVPSIDPYTAARWASLPRRPIGTAVRVEDLPGSSGTHRYQSERGTDTPIENKEDSEDSPEVYLDLPDSSDNSICRARYQNPRSPEESISYKSDEEPVLYIDLPEEGESDIYLRTPSQPDARRLNQTTEKEDDEPVVYIDIPECSGSGVSERRPEVEDGPSTSVVQETIFYDQFKDRRIDIATPRDADDSSYSSNNSTMRSPFRRPAPPTCLNLWSPGDSDTTITSTPRAAPTPPYYLTPQEYHQRNHRRTPEDDFRLPPLPVTEFPDPPPAYSEIDLGTNGTNFGSSVSNYGDHGNLGSTGNLGSPVTEPPAAQRTRVIVNATDSNRKYMTCDNCQMTVHSLVVRQTSLETHLAAIASFMCGCIPCAIMLYCCDFCKYKAHYCPNCNKVITYERCCKFCF